MGKRSRAALAPEYRARYVKEILDRVDLAPLVDAMPADAAAALSASSATRRPATARSSPSASPPSSGCAVTHVLPSGE